MQSIIQHTNSVCHTSRNDLETLTTPPHEHCSITQGHIMSLRMIEASRAIAAITKESLGQHFIDRRSRRKKLLNQNFTANSENRHMKEPENEILT
ncbi:MAG: hypothetical protein Q7K26_01460 [bacterium]|nr:hypothetical protein [bacterium]